MEKYHHKKSFQSIFFFLISLFILISALFASYYMIKNKPVAEKKEKSAVIPLIKVEDLKRENHQIIISALGKVIPSREIVLKTKISGELINVSKNFVPGAFFKKDELIAEIDDSDYLIALKKAEAAFEKALLNLELEKAQQEIAQKNYNEFLAKGGNTENEDFILRKPQMRAALADVKSSEASVEQAKLDLKRTKINAPFDCTIISIFANIGDQLSPQSEIAKIAGIESVWIEASIPKNEFEAITHAINGDNENVEVETTKAPLRGKIIETLSQMEENSQMVKVIIEVKHPFPSDKSSRNIFLNQIVSVKIFCNVINNCYKISRANIQEGKLCILTTDGTLKTIIPNIICEDKDWIYCKNEIPEGAKLIISDLPYIMDGMKLRTEFLRDNK